MKKVLIINSQAACSQIGGSIGRFALQRLGIEVISLPTLLVGRHPGWGDPGRVEIGADDIATMFLAIKDQGLLPKIDGILTGYFSSIQQITAANAIIDQIRAQNPNLLVAVDPVMGDTQNGLYVSRAVAEAMAKVLVPKADLITPNSWELERLTDRSLFHEGDVIDAAAMLAPKWVFVTDVPGKSTWVHLGISAEKCWKIECPKHQVVPKGTGDLLAALLLGRILLGLPLNTAFEMAVSSTQDIITETRRLGESELAVVAAQDRLVSPRTHLHAGSPDVQTKQCRWVAGIDGCQQGWLMVLLDVTGQKPPMLQPLLSIWDSFNLSQQPQKIAVDMPIGLLSVAGPGGRTCERAVRKILGPRRSSVFSAPCRAAIVKSTYQAASTANATSSDNAPKISKQSFGLFPKIREIDLRITPQLQQQLFETHPELAFTVLRNGIPCEHSKKTDLGREERQSALRSIGFAEEFLKQALPINVAASRDDLLDACACAWVAQRALLGAAKSYPAKPDKDERGLEMVIRV